MGLPDLMDAGIVETEPMMEAQILDSYTCVPGPGRCAVVEPSTSPGSVIAMLVVSAKVSNWVSIVGTNLVPLCSHQAMTTAGKIAERCPYNLLPFGRLKVDD